MELGFETTMLDYVAVVGIVVVLILIFIASYFIKKNKEIEGVDKKFIRDRWKKIEEIYGYKKEMNYKLAVIEADKLLDEVLKQMHFTGKTMAERLKLASYKFPKLKKVWWAHKVRNQGVHDVHYALRHGETRMVLKLFKQSLKELKVL